MGNYLLGIFIIVAGLGIGYGVSHFQAVTSQAAAVYDAFYEDVTVIGCSEVQQLADASYESEYIDLMAEGRQILLHVTDDQYCGTAGCQYRICDVSDGTSTVVPFGYAGTNLTLEGTSSNGMRDMLITTDDSDILLRWDGFQYLPE